MIFFWNVFLTFFLLVDFISCAGPPPPIKPIESRREREKVAEAVNSLPKAVHKTIKDMNAQGVPKEVIAEKIKLSSSGASANKIVDGVLRDDPWKTDKATRDAKKRQTKLKNEVKKQLKQERKKSRREL